MGIFTRIAERMDRQSQLMGAMMERLDVDRAGLATEAEGTRLQAAARSCLMCQDIEKCEAWLAGNCETTPDFCPNSAVFAMHRK